MAQPTNNAVEMTRKIREKNYQRLLGLSRTERLAFYRERARLMNAKAKKFIEAERQATHAS